jgi:hypothetical protein
LLLGIDRCSAKDKHLTHVQWLTQARNDGNITPEIFEKIAWNNTNKLLKLGL